MAKEVQRDIFLVERGITEEKLCAVGAAQCYRPDNARIIYENMADESIARQLTSRLTEGHVSILAHGVATFFVAGYTRRFLAQITRNTFLKPSVQSQQFILHKDFSWSSTPLIDMVPVVKDFIIAQMEEDQKIYNQVHSHLQRFLDDNPEIAKQFNKDQAQDDARLMLRNITESNMILTGTMWAWYEALPKRICRRNTEETVAFCVSCLRQLREQHPSIFNYCGAPCQMGECPEKRPCKIGPYPGNVWEGTAVI